MSGDIERIRDLIQPSDIKNCRESWNGYGNGWISPDGLFYECRPEGHRELSQYFSELGIIPIDIYEKGEDEQNWMDNHNWMKLSDGKFFVGGGYPDYKQMFPTQDQINRVLDYFEKFGQIKFSYRDFFTIDSFLEWVEEERGLI